MKKKRIIKQSSNEINNINVEQTGNKNKTVNNEINTIQSGEIREQTIRSRKEKLKIISNFKNTSVSVLAKEISDLHVRFSRDSGCSGLAPKCV